MPPQDRGLLARMDALVALVADHHGLALLPDGRLAAAEARAAARAAGLAGRARGDRLEATSLRHAWTQIDESLRAGLTLRPGAMACSGSSGWATGSRPSRG